MDRAFARITEPKRLPEPPEKQRDLLIEIRDLLQMLVGSGGGSRAWDQGYYDLTAAAGAVRLPVHQGRKSLSIYNAGPGNAYFGEMPHVNQLTGMPLPAANEREFEHSAEMWFMTDTNCRLIFSEEWQP